MPHMTGRVVGSLLVTMESERSIDSLSEEVRASGGAISMAIKDLSRLGWGGEGQPRGTGGEDSRARWPPSHGPWGCRTAQQRPPARFWWVRRASSRSAADRAARSVGRSSPAAGDGRTRRVSLIFPGGGADGAWYRRLGLLVAGVLRGGASGDVRLVPMREENSSDLRVYRALSRLGRRRVRRPPIRMVVRNPEPLSRLVSDRPPNRGRSWTRCGNATTPRSFEVAPANRPNVRWPYAGSSAIRRTNQEATSKPTAKRGRKPAFGSSETACRRCCRTRRRTQQPPGTASRPTDP